MIWGYHHFRKLSYIASPNKSCRKLENIIKFCILEKLFGICFGGYEKNWWYYYVGNNPAIHGMDSECVCRISK